MNPGSVGQPRDGDSRAGFGMVDTAAREMTIYRVEYPIAKAQARIMEEGCRTSSRNDWRWDVCR